MALKIRYSNSDLYIHVLPHLNVLDMLSSEYDSIRCVGDALDKTLIVLAAYEISKSHDVSSKDLFIIVKELLKMNLEEFETDDGSLEAMILDLATSPEFQDTTSDVCSILLNLFLNTFAGGVVSAYNEETELESQPNLPAKYTRA